MLLKWPLAGCKEAPSRGWTQPCQREHDGFSVHQQETHLESIFLHAAWSGISRGIKAFSRLALELVFRTSPSTQRGDCSAWSESESFRRRRRSVQPCELFISPETRCAEGVGGAYESQR